MPGWETVTSRPAPWLMFFIVSFIWCFFTIRSVCSLLSVPVRLCSVKTIQCEPFCFFCCFICIWLFLFYHFFSVKGCFWGLKPTKSKKYLNGSWCTLKSQHLLIYKMWRKWTVLLSFASVLIYFWVHYLFIFPSNFPLCFFFLLMNLFISVLSPPMNFHKLSNSCIPSFFINAFQLHYEEELRRLSIYLCHIL